MAAYHSMAHRMVSLPLTKESYEKETAKMVSIGRLNGYQCSTIEKIIAKHEKKKELKEMSTFYERQKMEKEEVRRASMTHYPEAIKHLKPAYRKHDIQLVHRSENKLGNLLGSPKEKPPKLMRSGIYRIECQTGCDFFYIGRTIRNPTKRFDEHMQDWINENQDENASAVAAHLLKNGHKIDIDNVKLVKEVRSKWKIDFEEAVYIHKNKHLKLMNRKLGDIDSPMLSVFHKKQ